MGASPTCGGVVRPKATVAVVVPERGSGGGGPVLHGDHGVGGVAQQPYEVGQRITSVSPFLGILLEFS
jgi:hypothetical protein